MAGMIPSQNFIHLLKLVAVGYESVTNSSTKIYTNRYASLKNKQSLIHENIFIGYISKASTV